METTREKANSNFPYVVVGGGIAGLVTALYLIRQNKRVALIESSTKLGGLLGVAHSWDRYNFDYGTHFISTTGIQEIDDFLFGENLANTSDWQKIPVLKAANYAFGCLNAVSPSLNLRDWEKVDPEAYRQACYEFMHAGNESNPDTLKEQIEQQFGQTVNQNVISPIMQKLYGCESDQLSTDAHLLFGINRLIFGSDEFIENAKEAPHFDSLLSYSSRDKGSNPLMCFYPPKGIGSWVESIEEELRQSDLCELMTSTNIVQMKSDKDGWALTCENTDKQEDISAKELMWSIPLPILAKSLDNIEIPEFKIRKMREIDLYHFVFDKVNYDNVHFYYNYDPENFPLRVTIYPQKEDQTGQAITVEVLRDKGKKTVPIEQIKADLIKQKLIDNQTVCMYEYTQPLATGFPVLMPNHQALMQGLNEQIVQKYPSIHLLGRGNAKNFFMKDVLIDVYQQMKRSIR